MTNDTNLLTNIDNHIDLVMDLMKHTGHIDCEALDRAMDRLQDASAAMGTAIEKEMEVA